MTWRKKYKVSDISIEFPVVSNFKKRLLSLFCLDNQTLFFSETTVIIPPKSASFAKLLSAKDDSIDQSFLFFHTTLFWQSKFSKECYLKWYRLIFKLSLLRHYKSDSPIKTSIENTAFLNKCSIEKSLFFYLASESWESKNSKVNLFCLIFLANQTHNWPTLQGLSPPSGWASKIFPLMRFFWLEKCWIVFLASVSWQSESSKKCYFSSFRSLLRRVFLNHYKYEIFHQDLMIKKHV